MRLPQRSQCSSSAFAAPLCLTAAVGGVDRGAETSTAVARPAAGTREPAQARRGRPGAAPRPLRRVDRSRDDESDLRPACAFEQRHRLEQKPLVVERAPGSRQEVAALAAGAASACPRRARRSRARRRNSGSGRETRAGFPRRGRPPARHPRSRRPSARPPRAPRPPAARTTPARAGPRRGRPGSPAAPSRRRSRAVPRARPDPRRRDPPGRAPPRPARS